MTTREEIELVFCLGGGELEDEPWLASVEGRDTTFPFWYDGAPEYTERDYRDFDNVRTVIEDLSYGESLAMMKSQDVVDSEGNVWTLREAFRSSGECECLHHGEIVGQEDWRDNSTSTASDEGREEDCPLCGESPGDEHGYCYLGDGWFECVYVQLSSQVDLDDLIQAAGEAWCSEEQEKVWARDETLTGAPWPYPNILDGAREASKRLEGYPEDMRSGLAGQLYSAALSAWCRGAETFEQTKARWAASKEGEAS